MHLTTYCNDHNERGASFPLLKIHQLYFSKSRLTGHRKYAFARHQHWCSSVGASCVSGASCTDRPARSSFGYIRGEKLSRSEMTMLVRKTLIATFDGVRLGEMNLWAFARRDT